jgi:hypothetical protein
VFENSKIDRKIGYRPYGPGSDLRSIFQFSHTLFSPQASRFMTGVVVQFWVILNHGVSRTTPLRLTPRKELRPKAQEGSPRLSWNPLSHPMKCKNVAKLSREEN